MQADYVTVVEDRPIMSVKYCLPVPFFHFWPKLTHPAARGICDSWASCYMLCSAAILHYGAALCLTKYENRRTESEAVTVNCLDKGKSTKFSYSFTLPHLQRSEHLVTTADFNWNIARVIALWNKVKSITDTKKNIIKFIFTSVWASLFALCVMYCCALLKLMTMYISIMKCQKCK